MDHDRDPEEDHDENHEREQEGPRKALFLFSTGNENYRDLLHEFPRDGRVVICYEGQHRFRKYDTLIANPRNGIHIFFRQRRNSPFIYLGMVNAADIVRERSDESVLCVRYVILQRQQALDARNKFAPFVGKLIEPVVEVPSGDGERTVKYPYREGVYRAFGAIPRDKAYCRQGICVVTLVD